MTHEPASSSHNHAAGEVGYATVDTVSCRLHRQDVDVINDSQSGGVPWVRAEDIAVVVGRAAVVAVIRALDLAVDEHRQLAQLQPHLHGGPLPAGSCISESQLHLRVAAVVAVACRAVMDVEVAGVDL